MGEVKRKLLSLGFEIGAPIPFPPTTAIILLCFDLLTRPKMPFKVIHWKEVTHSNGSYERNHVGRNWLMKLVELKKIPMVHYRVMHWKRVTSELHDSYFRLMTIKHSISKIEWASNDYIIELSSTSQLSWVPAREFEFQWRGDVVGKATWAEVRRRCW